MRKGSLRVILEVGAAMVAYSVVLVLVMSLRFLRENPDSPWLIPVAVAPVIPIVFIMLAVIRFVRRMDELQRRIHLEAVIISFLAAMMFCITYGFLENVGFPPFNTMFVGVGMAMFYAITRLLVQWKYR